MDNLTLIGVKVKVKLATTEVSGQVYAFLPDEELLLLVNEGPAKVRKYTIARLTKDAQVTKLEDAPEMPLDLVIPHVDLSRLAEKKPTVGEQILVELQKTYTVEWVGDSMLFADLGIRLAPPFESVRDISGADQSAVSRVAGVLARVRRKLGLTSN